MNEDSRRLLPPMSLLHALEAAGRTESFSKAADELGLTQGAVSRRIAQLEEWLGTSLFDRRGRRVTISAKGRQYLDAVAPGLMAIRRATSRMLYPPQEGTIGLASLPGFGMRWLARRLPRLTERHPDLVVDIAARADVFDFADEPFDAAIHVGPGAWPGTVQDPLFQEHVVPVVARSLAGDIGTPADLLRVPLLVQTERRDAWRRWFALSGISALGTRPGSSFGHFLMLAQALEPHCCRPS